MAQFNNARRRYEVAMQEPQAAQTELDEGLMAEALDEVAAMSEEEVNQSIRARGIDPDALARRMIATAFKDECFGGCGRPCRDEHSPTCGDPICELEYEDAQLRDAR